MNLCESSRTFEYVEIVTLQQNSFQEFILKERLSFEMQIVFITSKMESVHVMTIIEMQSVYLLFKLKKNIFY
jgi:hypothetical protein